MAFKILVFCLLGIGVTTLAQEQNPVKSLEKVCPLHSTYDCAVKIENCLNEQILAEEFMDYVERFNQNRDICSKPFKGSSMENSDKITACALQNIGIMVENKVNRPLVKRVLASTLTNSSQALQTAVAEAVDMCPEIPHPEIIEDYYFCLLKACVEALDTENKDEGE